MKFAYKISYIVTLTLLLFGCGKDESTDLKESPQFNYEYYPTEVGTYVEYDVNELNVELVVARTDTFFYHIKEVVESSYIDLEGRDAQRIERYRKEAGDTEWKIQDVWVTTKTKTTLERMEENIRTLNLIFPTVLKKEWKPNIYNNIDANYTGPMIAEYESIDEKETIGNKTYNNILVVKVKDTQTIKANRTETIKYAKNVGMVYRKYDEIELKENTNGQGQVISYESNIHKQIIMTATAFGKE